MDVQSYDNYLYLCDNPCIKKVIPKEMYVKSLMPIEPYRESL